MMGVELQSLEAKYHHSMMWLSMWLIVLAASLYGIQTVSELRWLSCIPLSLVMFGASVGLHECGHGTFFRHQRLNEALGVLFGVFAL